jgi:hypothetical protein
VRIYLVHVAPDTGVSDPAPVLLKDGFSFFAFLFTGFWALWHRMWLVGAFIFGGWFLLKATLALTGASDELALIISLAFSVIIGFSANDWLSASLVKRGYTVAGLVAAPRFEAALRRWFDLRGFART